MNAIGEKFLLPVFCAAIGLLLLAVANIINSTPTDVLAGVSFGFGLCLLLRVLKPQKGKRPTTAQQPVPQYSAQSTQSLPAIDNPLIDRVEAAVASEAASLQQAAALGTEFKRKSWYKTELAVNDMVDMFIDLIGASLPHCTVAVFFPAQSGKSYTMRRCKSSSAFVNAGATIVPKRGILGNLLADGLRPYYEPNFTNPTQTLYYYDERHNFSPQESIRSIMLHPITADDDIKGILLVDSTAENAYTTSDREVLANAAVLLGTAVYNTYLNTDNSIEYLRLTAMSNIAKDFWNNLELDAVLDKMCDTIPLAIPCDRLTISLKDSGKMSATVKRAYGADAEAFQNLRFPLGNDCPASIASTAYDRMAAFNRDYFEDRYEIRYTENEQRTGGLASFLAVPFSANKVKGLILLESARKEAFSKAHKELLLNIGGSAGPVLENIFSHKEIEDMATHDSMTGLYNRRCCMNILKKQIAAGNRTKEPLSLVMCDIDHFKKINDTHGHETGDVVIKGVAASLNNSIRLGIDIAARFGGEEFVLVFSKTNINEAKETTERIRQSIENTPFYSTGGLAVKVTMSFGIASYTDYSMDTEIMTVTESLLRNADKALYEAKNSGRNRVVVF
ncbi:MAG: sensor domain-containing diguanylate cyclase [Chitinispirillia bacterium]|nr:sensor domain-containing diguanylate cyclase [Chitinispirillia bacterium]MCL2242531.1 sensor domain-containing diguanylate cyclase [Chitinispirillia bacterium]